MMRLSLQAELLADYYVGDISADQVFHSAWRGMQEAVPFPMELSTSAESDPVATSAHEGVTFFARGGRMVIYSVESNSPLHGLLQPGDVVLNTFGDDAPASRYITRREPGDAGKIRFIRGGIADSVNVRSSDPTMGTSPQVERYGDLIYVAIGKIGKGTTRELADSLEVLTHPSCAGIILDLRNSTGGVAAESRKLTDFLLHGKDQGSETEALVNTPMVVLIDASTLGESENLARTLKVNGRATLIGSPTLGIHYADQALPLWSGETLYVEAGYPGKGDEAPSESQDGDSVVASGAKWEQDRSVVPDITTKREHISPMLRDLSNRYLIFDYVATSDYDSLPSPEGESLLLRDFLHFLSERNYNFDPLREAAQNLALHDLPPQGERAVRSLERKAAAASYGDPSQFADEIIPELLRVIWDVKVTRAASVPIRLRMRDTTLREAIDFIQHHETSGHHSPLYGYLR